MGKKYVLWDLTKGKNIPVPEVNLKFEDLYTILVTTGSNFKIGWMVAAGHHFEATSPWKSSRRLTFSGEGLPPVPGQRYGLKLFPKIKSNIFFAQLSHEKLLSSHSISSGLKITITSIKDGFPGRFKFNLGPTDQNDLSHSASNLYKSYTSKTSVSKYVLFVHVLAP